MHLFLFLPNRRVYDLITPQSFFSHYKATTKYTQNTYLLIISLAHKCAKHMTPKTTIWGECTQTEKPQLQISKLALKTIGQTGRFYFS